MTFKKWNYTVSAHASASASLCFLDMPNVVRKCASSWTIDVSINGFDFWCLGQLMLVYMVLKSGGSLFALW